MGEVERINSSYERSVHTAHTDREIKFMQIVQAIVQFQECVSSWRCVNMHCIQCALSNTKLAESTRVIGVHACKCPEHLPQVLST